MPTVDIRPVLTPSDRHTFLTFPWRIYRHDPVWVPPLLPERKKVIDPARGSWFKHGTADFFIAWRGKEPVGTICAAVDYDRNNFQHVKEGIFGFFDCIDDYEVASALFDTAAAWARERGLNTLIGPFNLDYEDGYGILLEGFDKPQVLLCGHTPPYYRGLVERYGFVQHRPGDNIAFEATLDIPDDDPRIERLARLAAVAEKRGHVTARKARLDDWNTEIDHALRILNKGLAQLADFVPWDRDSFAAHAESLKQIMDPDLVIFGLVNGEPVGWVLGLPNLNEAIQKANGLRHLWDYPRLLWYARRRPDCISFKSVAMDLAYENLGVFPVMMYALVQEARRKGYKWMDMSITAEDNPMTPRLAGRMGATLYKRYRTYRKGI